MCAEKQQLNASGGDTVIGRISSVQTMGTLDGPGVRFVAFLQGCPLRCACCHNPETWDVEGGSAISAGELSERVLRYREYFGKAGGVTLSGGQKTCLKKPVDTALTGNRRAVLLSVAENRCFRRSFPQRFFRAAAETAYTPALTPAAALPAQRRKRC